MSRLGNFVVRIDAIDFISTIPLSCPALVVIAEEP
jgi:hypothetical protein